MLTIFFTSKYLLLEVLLKVKVAENKGMILKSRTKSDEIMMEEYNTR